MKNSIVKNSDDFWVLGQGHVGFQLLWSALELKLFDILPETPIDLDALARKLGIESYPCRVLVSGLAAVGLVGANERGYFNTPWAANHLRHGGNYHKILGWQRHIVYPGLIHLTDSIRESKNIGLKEFPGQGSTLYDRLRSNPDLELIFQNAMSGLSTESREGLLTQTVFKRHKHIMDIGGGDGTNSIALLNAHPELKMRILDNESVIVRARKNIEANNLGDRVDFQVGNIFSAELPGHCDGFLMCHMVTIFSPEENIQIFKKCKKALPDSGRLFVFNMFTDDDGIGPVAPALGSAYFLGIATGSGFLYSTGEVRKWLLEAGFRDVAISEKLNLDHRLISATK